MSLKNFEFLIKILSFFFCRSLLFFSLFFYSGQALSTNYLWDGIREEVNLDEEGRSLNAFLSYFPVFIESGKVKVSSEKSFGKLMVLRIDPLIRQMQGSIVGNTITKKNLEIILQLSYEVEKVRLARLNETFFSEKSLKSEKNKKYRALFKAILNNRDPHFFNTLDSQKKELLLNFTLKHGQDIFVTDFLYEAIRHTNLPAVRYILQNKKQLPLYSLSGSFDPLSLALFTDASLEPDHSLKESAQQILRELSKYVSVDFMQELHIIFDISGRFQAMDREKGSQAMDREKGSQDMDREKGSQDMDSKKAVQITLMSPSVLMILLGLSDAVKFFHEKKDISFDEGLDFFGQGFMSFYEYTKKNGFYELNEYLKKKKISKKRVGPTERETCEKLFYH